MRSVILVPAVFLILGCGDTLSPSEVVGTYTLVTIQGQPPPLLVLDTPECQETVWAGSLRLEPAGDFELQLDLLTVCPNPTGPGEVAVVWGGQYRIDGSTVVLGAIGDPSVDYRAMFRGNRLVVDLEWRYGEVGFVSVPTPQ